MKLREFLNTLESEGELVRVKKEVSPNLEAANVMNALHEKPVIFENVQGKKVFGGICSKREYFAKALGCETHELLHKVVSALNSPTKTPVVDSAPCQEVVEKDVDLDALPILTYLKETPSPYISSAVCVMKDPDTGMNSSYHRLMKTGKNTFTTRLIQKRQTANTWEKVKEDMPFAMCVGNSMSVLLAASLGPAPGVFELEIANALEETPLVKCKTNDLLVPADAEYVLEGRITRDLADEGPFVDLTETIDPVRQQPIVVVDAITHRKDAMFQALLPGQMEHKLLMGMPKEPTIYDAVSKVCDCKNVVVTRGGGCWLHAAVQIRKKNADDGAKAAKAAFEGHKSMKHVIVVDEDVDLNDANALEWCLATRFQADKDAVVMPGQPGSSLDPSGIHEKGKKTLLTKVAVDATIKGNKEKYKKVEYGKINLGDY